MKPALVYSRACRGLEAIEVKVEVHIASGMPCMHIVGLPETAVRESKYRVRAVLSQAGFQFPYQRITVNLAPADLPKEGGRFDLPIALGILTASGQLPQTALENCEFISELSLSGSLLPVKGVIPAVIAAARAKRKIVIPDNNAGEAQLARKPGVFSANHILEVCSWLHGEDELNRVAPVDCAKTFSHPVDMHDVRGQHHAARALEICAAGRHHCLMLGAPGSGKTMLATRMPTIMPPMDEKEALTTTAIASLSQTGPSVQNFYRRPFRSPHHTASAVALVGGGGNPTPGEISKAHNGILFLDELPEFGRIALDALREPLETGTIHLSRAAYSVEFPARFQLIAAMNPCPDGLDVDQYGRCPCDEKKLARYYARLSAPMLDRFDMHVRVPRLEWGRDANSRRQCESSKTILDRVTRAWEVQLKRQGKLNSSLQVAEMEQICRLSKQDTEILYRAVDRLKLSTRALHRILKVARTIADLAQVRDITQKQLLEAVTYRSMDGLRTR